jgi:Tol biopolymer transport system component
MKHFALQAGVLAVLVAGGWHYRPAAAEDPVLVFSGWDYRNKKPAWDIYSLTLSGESKVVLGSPVNKVYAFAFPKERAAGYLTEKSGTEERQIFKLDLESGASTALGISIFADSTCQVSPDGRQLACGDLVGEYFQIVVFDLATKTKREITSFKNYSTDPSWSPDGKSLVYATGDLAGKVGEESKPRGKHLAVYNFDSNTHRLLTRAPDARDGYPRWSPDGQWISFHRPGKKLQGWNLWLIRPDGSGASELTVTDREDSHPAWSPDSSRIAFQSYRSNKSFDVYLVDVATKELTRVTATDKVEEHQPIWMPPAGR